MRAIQSSVKARIRPQAGPAAARLAILRDVLSPWDGISLTYRQLAAELGKPVTEAAVKQHLSRLYDKFAVYEGKRRVRPANEAMRSRCRHIERSQAGASIEGRHKQHDELR